MGAEIKCRRVNCINFKLFAVFRLLNFKWFRTQKQLLRLCPWTKLRIMGLKRMFERIQVRKSKSSKYDGAKSPYLNSVESRKFFPPYLLICAGIPESPMGISGIPEESIRIVRQTIANLGYMSKFKSSCLMVLELYSFQVQQKQSIFATHTRRILLTTHSHIERRTYLVSPVTLILAILIF